jgi:hypothetical protein
MMVLNYYVLSYLNDHPIKNPSFGMRRPEGGVRADIPWREKDEDELC